MSAPSDWHQIIAEIPTANEHAIEVVAEYTSGRKLVVLDGHALDLDHAAEMVAAINRAVEVLSLT